MAAGSLIAALVTSLAVTACSTPPAAQPAPVAVARAEQNQPVGTRVPPPASADVCKAQELQWLVGKPKTEIPVPVEVVNRRVTCTTCPVTEDFSPYRLNIFFNAQTDIVELVRCG